MELLRSCTKPSIYFFLLFHDELFLLFLNLKLENYSVFTFLLFLDLKLEYYSVFTFLLFLDLQDCSNSSELAMGLLQSCTKPSISFFYFFPTYFFTFSQPQVGKLFRIYVFTFSRPEVGKLFLIYFFTFFWPEVGKLFHIYFFTFSQTEVGKLLLIYLFTFSRKSSLIYPFKEIIVFLVCQFQSMGICNR